MFHLDTVVSNVKMREKKKELTNGPNNMSCVVWARSCCHGGWWRHVVVTCGGGVAVIGGGDGEGVTQW